MKKIPKNTININLLNMFVVLLLTTSLTACQNSQVVQNEQDNQLQEVKKPESQAPEQNEIANGEIIFLEIAPKTQLCSPRIEQKCLKVRDVYYNKNWVQSGTSDWRLMQQPIKGYRHNPKICTVLRVKKYITDLVDTKGKQPVYVLDMVIETGVVQ